MQKQQRTVRSVQGERASLPSSNQCVPSLSKKHSKWWVVHRHFPHNNLYISQYDRVLDIITREIRSTVQSSKKYIYKREWAKQDMFDLCNDESYVFSYIGASVPNVNIVDEVSVLEEGFLTTYVKYDHLVQVITFSLGTPRPGLCAGSEGPQRRHVSQRRARQVTHSL